MKKSAGAPPQEVRLLGGQWKRSKLPVADRPGLRPTPSRVRETLFNWLGQDLTGWRCFDAFAGTGALGFEAASRGAREVLMVEQEPSLVAQLQAIRARLKAEAVRVQRGDGLAALRAAAGQGLDVVFLDPPFDAVGLFEPALRAARAAVAAEGFVYLEAPRPWAEAELGALGLALHRHGRAGAVAFHLLRPSLPGATG
ncbi:MAG: 16S rRNA (guanine(966)-N(2))-methyltransferase RsmD [Hydrogenophaga sp.]|uniref:16S rRNA (guanine(966)-N(2))-methyltransferase RsmD n=1 Tax=Hydrogenophaga sp. TaxID=1904254 RepID=UPI00169ACE5D|nr:16S rRNA (guanine(966)-N(2))-methyltransferase RsmD [Hydrogenophaga sp.]NIM42720.1 16S rRNA (guanine(966)-N(2))-methyltransferase RsmD [Hydrogenophaga sp.]NIN25763.1 16S rRNA (guanine(966)-N(2))-methyltransferase RsmD [Hydrogenophaga sp.]NIN30425.1 16S rRNA (guanine(966)-N(2))-methyltransferase RsmD [Hydrogenophaga sp.]NIN56765.1 16S rRNA (guanine(966)-N(2))-methyltransferase RsmD [Hydrogenophaga sp.]NIO53340.1 16S rRNA (guanine(966)-N(2))-methyltransferase RsmD [Hydrogenophaga sp.]